MLQADDRRDAGWLKPELKSSPNGWDGGFVELGGGAIGKDVDDAVKASCPERR